MKKNTKINIILPLLPKKPIGGFKVLFEYANQMVEDSCDVTIYYPKKLKPENIKKGLCHKFLLKVFQLLKKFKKHNVIWFNLNKKVKEEYVYTLEEKYIKEADIIIATSWETAAWIGNYSTGKGKKLYLIQGFETWSGTKEEIFATWRMPFQKIAIAQWLKNLINEIGEECSIIRNGLDHEAFGIDINIADRNHNKISMLYHKSEIKGSGIGIEALKIVKKSIPNLEVDFFSTYKRNTKIPKFINYYVKPKNLRKIYNNSSIFITTSFTEGWGLPRAEAMLCGCATIITNIEGHKDYGIDGEHYLMVPPKDSNELANTIIKLIDNKELMYKISESGNKLMKKFSWESSYQQMKTNF
ncbi:glycosyltransferase family 4 protein [Flavobacterium sp. DSR3-2]|uniref:glycosyltransferase family 4 protein n=1 Tax=Flavobacterium sp. DSR3-2 TaxID=2804634 RepID=UPI003CE6EDE5